MTISLFLTAFVMGLLGSGHCVAMCGGVASSLSLAIKEPIKLRIYTLLYNLGRVCSYCVAGALVSLLGSHMASRASIISQSLSVISAVFMILVGFYIMRLAQTLNWLEKLGKFAVWQHLVKLNKYLMPINRKSKAFLYGALWGWLPCGLVYSALLWTVSLSHPIEGAFFMFSFALGTLPAMLTLGFVSHKIKDYLNHIVVRLTLGNIFLFYGLYLLLIALL